MRSKKLFVVLLGFMISFGAAMLLCNSTVKSKQIPVSKLVHYGYGWEHIGDNNRTIRLLEDKVSIKYFVNAEGTWNYREFYISNLTGSEQITADVRYFDKQKNELIRTVENWGMGRNLIRCPIADFQSLKIYFYNQKGVSFTIEGMGFMDSLPHMEKKKTLFCSLFFFCFYMLLVWIIRRYVPLEIFLHEVRSCERDLFETFKSKKKSRISGVVRIILWICIFFIAVFIEYQIQMGMKKPIRYLELGILLLLFLLGNMYGRKRKNPLPIEAWISYIWISMCVWFLISDFFIRKPCQFVGLILLFGVGYLIYHVTETGNMECLFRECIMAFILVVFLAVGMWMYLESAGAWTIPRPHGISDLLYIWKGYLMNLNLLGHNSVLFWGGREVLPYSSILKIGYTYGTVAIACYISIWFWIFYQGKQCFLKKGASKKAWFGGIVFIFLCSMVMNVL